MNSQVSFASTDNILSVPRSILVVQIKRPTVDAVLLFYGEYVVVSFGGSAASEVSHAKRFRFLTSLCSYFYLRKLDDVQLFRNILSRETIHC